MLPPTPEDNDATLPRPIVVPPLPVDQAPSLTNTLRTMTSRTDQSSNWESPRRGYPVIAVALMMIFILVGILVTHAHGLESGKSVANLITTPSVSSSVMPVQSMTPTTIPPLAASTPTQTTPTIGSIPKTATPITIQTKTATPTPSVVTITFKRTTEVIYVEGKFVVATDGSGQVLGHMAQVNTQGFSMPIAAYDASNANLQLVTLTVTNTSGTSIVSPVNVTVRAQNYGMTCTTYAAVTVPANGHTQQQCVIHQAIANTNTWNDTNANPPLVYSGTTPNMASSSTWWVPYGCGSTLFSNLQNNSINAADSVGWNLAGSDGFIFGGSLQMGAVQCNPNPGTLSNQQFNFTQFQTVTGTIGWVSMNQIQTYVNTVYFVQNAPANEVFVSSNNCSGPGNDLLEDPGTTTLTQVTMLCDDHVTYAWNWDATALNQLAHQISGMKVSAAIQLMNTMPGITPGSVVIVPTSGNLPTDPNAYQFMVNP